MIEDLKKAFVEKIIIGTIAIVVSTFILHGYNEHQKAFENAQIQLHSISSYAVEKKNEILKSAGDLTTFVYNQATRPSLKKPSADMKLKVLDYLTMIRTSAAILQPRFPKSAKLAKQLEGDLFKAIYDKIGDSNLNFQEKDLTGLETTAASTEAKFLDAFDKELADALSLEYGIAYPHFYDRYTDPTVLAVIAVIASIILVVFLLRAAPPVA